MDRREAVGVTDSRSSSVVDDESANFTVWPFRMDMFFFRQNMSASSLVTTRRGSNLLREFEDLRELYELLPQ
jgi:hypothetical protein